MTDLKCALCLLVLKRDFLYVETDAEFVIEGYAVCQMHARLFEGAPRFRMLSGRARSGHDPATDPLMPPDEEQP